MLYYKKKIVSLYFYILFKMKVTLKMVIHKIKNYIEIIVHVCFIKIFIVKGKNLVLMTLAVSRTLKWIHASPPPKKKTTKATG